MTEQEREELIEKMARALAQSHVNGLVYQNAARAALDIAEPVIREQAGKALRDENARLREALNSILINPAKPDYSSQDFIIRVPEYVLFDAYAASQPRKEVKRADIREGGKTEQP